MYRVFGVPQALAPAVTDLLLLGVLHRRGRLSGATTSRSASGTNKKSSYQCHTTEPPSCEITPWNHAWALSNVRSLMIQTTIVKRQSGCQEQAGLFSAFRLIQPKNC
jgi:hypothetical protein